MENSMVMHYSSGPEQIACGRNNHNLIATSKRESVTCKSCRSSEVFQATGTMIAENPQERDTGTSAAPLLAAEGRVPKGRVKVVTATQSMLDVDLERYEAWRKKTVAFEEWRQSLNRGDRLPRGRFFKGKKPGCNLIVLDECWQTLS